jgi:hypothetical protein
VSNGFLPPLMNSPEPMDLTDQVMILASLGHFRGKTVDQALAEIDDNAAIQSAVKSWQAFHSRNVTGVLSATDQAYMLQPRCGIADIGLATTNSKWGVLDITVSHNMSGLNAVTQEDINAAWLAAVQSWNSVCGIRMKPVGWAGSRGTNIWATSQRIDGRAGTLAWSYLATNNLGINGRLEQRYELSEDWTRTYLQAVIAHELGHALGMDHSSSSADLMYPYARRNVILPQKGDIARVVDRYGKPTVVPPVDPPVDPPATPSSIKRIVVHFQDGTTSEYTTPGTASSYPFF